MPRLAGSKNSVPRVSSGYRSDVFEEAVFSQILHRMMNGEAVTKICKEKDMPDYSVFVKWTNSSPDRFNEYARARQIQADYYVDECIDIVDTDVDPQRARNRIQARQWHASKIAPRAYGQKIQQEIEATVRNKFQLDLSQMSSSTRDALRSAILEQMKRGQTIDSNDYEVESE